MSQINVNTIKDKSGLGAPSFPNGVNATGVITATSFRGDGGSLTGIDASSLRVGGSTKVQATSTGLVISGIASATNFKTGSTNVHSVGVEAAGINVLGGDTPIGAGSTIYDNGNASFNGNVTSDGNITAAGNVTAAGNINANGNIVGDNSTNITGINDATFAGNVSVGGTLTYEDVSNIDSVGLITARSGVNISDTTESTSTTTGSLKVAGGVGIVKNLHVGGTSQFKDVTIPSANKISTSANNLIIDSASGTVVVSNNFITNGSNTLGSALQNNTTYINSTTAAHSNATTLVVGHGSGNYAGMTFQCAAGYPGGVYFTDTDNGQQGGIAYYHNGDQLRFIAGETQYMSIDSSAITAVNSVPFVGNLTGNVTGNTSGSSGSCTGNALTATTLTGNTNTKLNDNIQLQFGSDTDYYIKHDGSNCWHRCTTGNLELKTYGSSAGNLNFESKGSSTFKVNENTTALTLASNGNATFGATVTATTFSGSGASLTSLNASNLSSGTVATARLGSGTADSSRFLRGDGSWAYPDAIVIGSTNSNSTYYPVFTDGSGNNKTISKDASNNLAYNPSTNVLTAGSFSGSGTDLTSLNASNLGSGTVASARLGSSGTRSSSTYLRGDNTWADDGVFLRSDANDSMSGVLNLTSSTNKKLILSGSSSPSLYLQEGTTDKVQLQWDSTSGFIYFWNEETNRGFQLGSTPKWYNGSGYNTMWHAGNDGAGSGLDADLLDGIDSSSFLRSDANDSASGSYSFTNSYNAFGNSTGSVSNNGSWNARVNVAGSSHARLDVQSVSDGIITTMSAHTGHTKGQLGTRSNHGVSFIANGNERAVLTTGGAFSVTDTISDSKGNLRSIPRNNQGSAYTLVSADAGKCITAAGNITVNNSVFSEGDAVTIIADTGSDLTITQGSGVTMYNAGDASTGNKTLAARGMCTIWFVAANNCYISGAGLS